MSSLHLFTSSYAQSDGFGKCIFLTLACISIFSWALIIYKTREIKQVQKAKKWLKRHQSTLERSVLSIETPKISHPFSRLYSHIQKAAFTILKKNERSKKSYLSKADIDSVAHQSAATINNECQKLQSYLFVFSMVVALAPFLGLLGTVWGILLSFSEMQMSHGSAREVMLSGLATALSTTVLGLIVAIPSLIASSFLKESAREIEHDLDQQWTELVSALELQYRQESGSSYAPA